MKIDSIMVGPIMTNCYLLSDETAGVCALIDPGDEVDRVLDMVSRSGCALQYILLTHGHFDHTTAVRPILERYPDLPVYINEKDVVDGRQGDMELVFSRLPEHNQRYYHDGDTLTLGSLTITVLETPGHSKGSVCLVVGDVIFSGDTLFRCSCGRTRSPARTTGPGWTCTRVRYTPPPSPRSPTAAGWAGACPGRCCGAWTTNMSGSACGRRP